jgi:hypothetical protein
MPNLDGMGPAGKGPMTGRGKGSCKKGGKGTFKAFLKSKSGKKKV